MEDKDKKLFYFVSSQESSKEKKVSQPQFEENNLFSTHFFIFQFFDRQLILEMMKNLTLLIDIVNTNWKHAPTPLDSAITYVSLCFAFGRRSLSETGALTWCSSSRASLWCDPVFLWGLQLFGSYRSEGQSSQRGWRAPPSPEPAGLEGTAGGHGPSAPDWAPHWPLGQAQEMDAMLGWPQLS